MMMDLLCVLLCATACSPTDMTLVLRHSLALLHDSFTIYNTTLLRHEKTKWSFGLEGSAIEAVLI